MFTFLSLAAKLLPLLTAIFAVYMESSSRKAENLKEAEDEVKKGVRSRSRSSITRGFDRARRVR